MSIEDAIKIGKTYTLRSDLQKKAFSAYNVLKKCGLLDEIIPSKTPIITYEKAYNAAKKYTLYSRFREEENTIYIKSFRKGWIKDFTWLNKNAIDEETKEHLIYIYKFTDYNTFYVGRTKRLKQRHNRHLTDEKDSVFQFIKSKNISNEECKYEVLKDNLNAKESQYYEGFYLDEYIRQGWQPLNKVKTGSLGGNVILFTYEKCYEEALKYKTTTEFYKKSTGAYVKSKKMGWDKDYVWLEKYDPFVHYTFEECYEKAKLYKSLNDFYVGDGSFYRFSKQNNFLPKFTWLYSKPRYDNIIEYSLDGVFIKEYANNEIVGTKRQSIISNAKGCRKYSYDRIWKFKSDVVNENGEVLKSIDGISAKYPYQKEIVQYNKEGHFIQTYNSVKDAADTIGYSPTSICDALKGEKTIFCGGYLWKYKEDVTDEKGNILKKVEFRDNRNKRKINQINQDGEIVESYTSLTKVYEKYSRYVVDWTLQDKWKKSKTNNNPFRFGYRWEYVD